MTANLIVSTDKLSSLIKITTWQAHVVHMAKHMHMVGDPFWWGALAPLTLALNHSTVV